VTVLRHILFQFNKVQNSAATYNATWASLPITP
jgi:hypothetical protein